MPIEHKQRHKAIFLPEVERKNLNKLMLTVVKSLLFAICYYLLRNSKINNQVGDNFCQILIITKLNH